MKSIISFSGVILLLLFTFLSCKSEPKNNSDTEAAVEPPKETGIKVVTTAMDFICLDTIQSGWTKFIYENKSTEPHFILLDKYPEGKSIEDTHRDIVPPFDEGMALIMEGKNEEAMAAFGKLPEWFSEIVFLGGTGLLSPGKTAVSHVKMEPGYYIMECYVKMPDGKFHTSMGMTKELFVLDESNELVPPAANIEIQISSTEGIRFEGEFTTGENIFQVTYEDQIVHENFVGHDISLVKVGEGADLKALEAWMNWATPEGLMSATLPEGFEFLGGTNDAPAGSVLFFEANLEPGEYAFISEVPNAESKGMLIKFSVAD